MNKETRVWDPLVRIFHWSLVATFVISYLSGDEDSALHIYAGYAVLGLIVFRVLWGFVGSRYARFSNFVSPPGTVIRYLKSLVAGKPESHLGHNPAGGWMIIAMLLCLFTVSVSGLKVYAIEEGRGPLAADLSLPAVVSTAQASEDDDHEAGHGSRERDHHEDEEFWEEIHEVSSNFMLFLIFLHVAGVLVSGRLHGENLVKAMITGKKRSNAEGA